MINSVVSRIENELKDAKNRYLDIPDGFYRDAKYIVDILVTGEEMDTGARTQTLSVALQILGSNPAILQDKVTRAVFFKLLEIAGIPPIEVSALAESKPSVPAVLPQGGSVSSPVPAGANSVQQQLKI